MEKTNEVNVERWVDDRLAKLTPDAEWQPSLTRAFARFEERRVPSRTSKWTWLAVAVLIAAVLFFAFPDQRAYAARVCVGACESIANTNFEESIHNFFLGVHAWLGIAPPPGGGHATKESQLAPDFTLKDAAGAEIRLSNYKGKVVLLNFWATWCESCNKEIPWFVEFERTHASQGFAVIGVSMDEDGWKSVKPFISAQKINYRVAIGDEALAQKFGGVDSIPETLLIDRQGKIVVRHIGLVSKSNYESEIVQLLKK